MKNRVPTSLFTATILFLGLSTTCLALDIPGTIDINLQASNPALDTLGKDSKSAPAFNHAKHASSYLTGNSAHAGMPYNDEFTCTACHAGVKSAGDIRSETTRQRQAEEVANAGGVKKYMHNLCLDCHKSMKKATLSTGPTSCKGCHAPQ
jgi:hypothetical protein